MTIRISLLGCLIVLGLLTGAGSVAVAAAAAEGEHNQVFLNNEDLKWQAAPPGLPPGGKVAVLFGDPHQPGPFVIRLSTPAGYKIMPHWHSRAENLTVVSGMLNLGDGDDFSQAKAHPLKVGGYHYLPERAHHFAYTEMPTVIQIHGEGPFDIIYVNSADDPRKGK